ncbi:crotonobetaine/carnitine-CoA ligase [Pseudonocardia hierapolitana]|uniref:Crotonobetaine/carnitine-CoA ligase n=1 Tax=Pseudonocardia hierapolitana TaxID=1128676 RepID=A0A561SSU1_9PSEU|nr:AMP-binding protein [Pseudonocardia hierapolitana]TWF77936.1 crotonobetaine/carnitine-CoA ligase [Pseudonocardia hierapolitana]
MNQEWLEGLVLGDVLRSRAETHGDAAFLKFRDGELSFAEVDVAADRYANGFAAEGVGRGHHVAVMLPNCPEFVPVIVALARLGAVAVPVNTAYRGELLRHVLDSADVSTLLIDAEFTDRLPEVLPVVPRPIRVIVRGQEPSLAVLGDGTIPMSRLLAHGADPVQGGARFSDLQAIMYTSGTTGRSKGAMVPHALAMACAYDSLDFLDRWGKTTYCPLPLFHAAGLWDGVFSSLLSGSPIGIVERFSASRFWDDVRYFDAQVTMSVFAMIPILLSAPAGPRDHDHPLETFYMGKSALDAPLLERFGVRSAETYTSTEVGIATGSPYGQWRLGSMGQAHAERFEVAVVDEDDREVPAGEPGELVVRPKQPFVITTGYYGMPEATARAFRNMWFHTGDRAWRDDDGYFYFLDRIADAIRRRGENISAFDIECEVNLHPEIVESAAFGVPSELGEEDVKLAVVRAPGSDLSAPGLAAYCAAKLPSFMVPRYIEFVGELPRTPTDKVAKHELRARGDQGITPGTWDREQAAPSTRASQASAAAEATPGRTA